MANKECEKIRNLLPLYIDNMLSDKESDEVITHLDKCPDCKNEYKYLKAIIGTAKEIPERELSSDFHKNLMEKVKSEAQKKKKRYITLRHISAGVAAAAVIAISFVALGEINEPKEMELTDQFITSRLSDEPIQKDADSDKLANFSSASEEKNINKSDNKTSQASKNTVIEEKEVQTSEQIPASISLDEETKTYKTATVTLTEENRDEILKILSDFKQDDVGYIVEDIEDVVKKLKETGASVITISDNADVQNYIVVK